MIAAHARTKRTNDAALSPARTPGQTAVLRRNERQLVSALINEDLVLYFGAGGTKDVTGTGWKELTNGLKSKLAEKGALPVIWDSLPPTTQAEIFESKFGRCELVNSVRDAVELKGSWPTDIARAILGLGFKIVITSNYDNGLEDAYMKMGIPYKVVAYEHEVMDNLLRPPRNGVLIIKMHGDADSGKVVLTDSDFLRYEDEHKAMRSLVLGHLREKRILTYGAGLEDRNLESLFNEVARLLPRGEKRDGGFALVANPSHVAAGVAGKHGLKMLSYTGPKELTRKIARVTQKAAVLRDRAKCPVEKTRYFGLETLHKLETQKNAEVLRLAEELLKFLDREPKALFFQSGRRVPIKQYTLSIFDEVQKLFDSGHITDGDKSARAGIFIRFGEHLARMGNLSRAILALESAWSSTPYGERSDICRKLGNLYLQAEDYRSAHAKFREGIDIDRLTSGACSPAALSDVSCALRTVRKLVEPLINTWSLPGMAASALTYHLDRFKSLLNYVAKHKPGSSQEASAMAKVCRELMRVCGLAVEAEKASKGPFKKWEKMGRKFQERASQLSSFKKP